MGKLITKSGRVISEAEAFSKVPKQNALEESLARDASPLGQLSAIARDVGGYAAGNLGQASDMFSGILGGIARLPLYVGARSAALTEPGMTQKLAAQAGKAATELVPEAFTAPYGVVARELGPQAEGYYANSGLGQLMELISSGVQAGGKAAESAVGIPGEDVEALADLAMTGLGVAGVRKPLRQAQQRLIDNLSGRTKAREAIAESAKAAVESSQKRIADSRAPIAAAAPEEVAASPEATVAELRAAEREAARAAEEARRQHFQDLEAAKAAYEQPKPAAPERVDWTEVNDILQKEGAFRTPEEQIRLRQYMNRTGAQIRAGGAADPRLLGIMAGLSTGAVVWNNLDDDVKETVKNAMLGAGGVSLGMAVKGPGGMWHPEAVARLASPLLQKLSLTGDAMVKVRERFPAEVNSRGEIIGWNAEKALGEELAKTDAPVKRMVRNYLNKHAGTATDPLKDVEIPFGEGTKRWEEVTDAVIQNAPAKYFSDIKAPPNEAVYTAETQIANTLRAETRPQTDARMEASRALNSYLSHVGDYLRQNVPAEKLGQYDFIRAVKETAKWDADMAKQMEKSRADMTSQMPVYKDYGNGYRWVEVKGPDRATTERLLKDEGDQMGHCVGGYCDYVENGDSKIYSLRDAKGRSHVTVEVEPGWEPGTRSDVLTGKTYNDTTGRPDNILQIKGKQNRAPKAEYLPYVQDFVKSGKWGGVGDLENAGLVKSRLGVQDGPWQYLTPEEAEVAATRGGYQRGSASPELLAKLGVTLGAAATGAVLSDDPLQGAVLAGVGSLALLSRRSREAILNTLDRGLGMASTRVLNASPAVLRSILNFERRNLTELGKVLKETDPFFIELDKLPSGLLPHVEAAITENNFTRVRELLADKPEMLKQLDTVLKLDAQLGQQLLAGNRIRKLVKDHFPRVVKDWEGLKETLGQEALRGIEKQLADATQEAVNAGRQGLTPLERSEIINAYLQRKGASSFQPDFAKRRTIQEITPELMKFYAKPVEAWHTYVREATLDLEAARFFGRDLKTLKKDGLDYLDYNKSIGAVVERALREGTLSPDKVAEVTSILQSRFRGGEQPAPKWSQDLNNIAYGSLLGNWIAPIAQHSDLAVTAHAQGMIPTLQAVFNVARGKAGIRPADIGLINHVAEEFYANTKSQRYAQWALSRGFPFTKSLEGVWKDAGSFSQADMLQKSVLVEAARTKLEGQAKTPRGEGDLAQRYAEYFGEDFPQFVQDLKQGKRSDLVLEALFFEGSRTQPLSRMERSQFNLDNPQARVVFALKNWALKQADYVRREIYEDFKHNRWASGARKAISYSVMLGAGGAAMADIQNWLLGRPSDIGIEDIAENVAKTFALNSYVRDTAEKKGWFEAVKNIAAPPWQMFDDIRRMDEKAIGRLPVVGPILYNHFFGGKEQAALREELKEKREARESAMTPEQKETMRRLREERKEKRARDAYERRSDGKIVFENYSGLTFSDTPSEREAYDEPSRTMQSHFDFIRRRTNTAWRHRDLAQEDEDVNLLRNARKKGGAKFEREVRKRMLDRQLENISRDSKRVRT